VLITAKRGPVGRADRVADAHAMAAATTAKTTINVNVLGVMLLIVTSNLPFLIFDGAMDRGQ
jgi:hypothetical protein